MIGCRIILVSKSLHSRACSSSHANKPRRHRQASPFSPHPRAYISATVTILLMDKSNRRLKVFFNITPSIQGSHQKRVLLPSPTSQPMLSSIHLPTPTPVPKLMVIKLFHQTESNLPPLHTSPLKLYTTNSYSPPSSSITICQAK